MKIIRAKQVCEKMCLSRTTLWRLTTDGTNEFPPKINISDRLIGYDEALIEEWLTKQTINKKP